MVFKHYVVSRLNTGLLAGQMESRIAEVLGNSMSKLDASIAAAVTR